MAGKEIFAVIYNRIRSGQLQDVFEINFKDYFVVFGEYSIDEIEEQIESLCDDLRVLGYTITSWNDPELQVKNIRCERTAEKQS